MELRKIDTCRFGDLDLWSRVFMVPISMVSDLQMHLLSLPKDILKLIHYNKMWKYWCPRFRKSEF